MIIHKAYKTELAPTNVIAGKMRMFAGAARYAWNWALARINDRTSKPNQIELHKEWNVWKKENAPWTKEVSKCPPHQAFIDISNAFARWFDCARKKKAGIPSHEVGHPKFKKKSRWSCKFTIGGGTKQRGHVIVNNGRVYLPKLGWIKLKEKGYIPVGRHTVAHVSQQAGRWFISVPVQVEVPDPVQPDGDVLGIDPGVKTGAACSDGTKFENPKALERKLAKLAELEKKKSQQIKGSNRRNGTNKKISKLHWRIANVRRDAAHKASAAVVKTKPSTIVIESLSVADMLVESTDHGLNRRNSDAGMSQFASFVEYKSKWNGIEFVRADRYYPSTQRCSACANIKTGAEKLTMRDRIYVCHIQGCSHAQDRDENAAQNLKQYGLFGWTPDTWRSENEKLFTASSAGCARRSLLLSETKRELANMVEVYNYVQEL